MEQPQKKKRKISDFVHTDHTVCCSCLEEDVPHLLFTGCSNRHTMCHPCSRMFFSERLVMNKFPQNFPGKISSRKDIQCPLCKETINGVSNIFIFSASDASENHLCPYAELLGASNVQEHGCEQKFTTKTLHLHLLESHAHTVKCPNCNEWLSDPNKNVEDLLLFHVLKKCQHIICVGCDRNSNMISMYMHSQIGRDGVCESARQWFVDFGKTLAETSRVFTEVESLTSVTSMMLRWILQYMYVRFKKEDNQVNIFSEAFNKQFNRIFFSFVFQAFHCFHKNLPGCESSLEKMIRLIRNNDPSAYEDFMLFNISVFSQKDHRLDQISRIPMVYRLLMITLSDFVQVKQLYRKYPKNIQPHEQADIDALFPLFEKVAVPQEFLFSFE
jgi:hypothetical protein